MRGIVAALAAGIMLIGATPPANATPEQDFLGILAATPGVTVNGFTGPLLTNAGNAACTDLRGGATPADAANHLMWYPGATNAGMAALVNAAQRTLCPDTVR